MTTTLFKRRSLLLAATTLRFAVNPALAIDKFTNVQTVGIISSFGDTVELKKIGTTILSYSEDTIPISDWKINETVVQDVSVALRDRFAVKPVANNPSTFTNESADFQSWKQKQFVSLPENSDIDAYIMILPSSETDPLGTANSLEGLGFLNHSRIFGTPKLALYAIYKVYIIDAKTGSRIEYGSAQVPDSAFLTSASPYALMQESQWIASASQLGSDEKAALRDQFIALIRKSMPHTNLRRS